LIHPLGGIAWISFVSDDTNRLFPIILMLFD